ncbi:MAG: EthD domain-containing protein [Haliea sp.]|jgi:hypothetical protein|nr:EthD domain-containing protein [Haliea sp.]MDP4788685.1 EthD domain-containing protein [Haliea sp.]MDP5063263.1 EthD domain-containing protein [Haliea sp.]
MEKVQYCLWRNASVTEEAFRSGMLAELVPALQGLTSVRGVRLALVDAAVAPAVDKRMASSGDLPDALLSVWVDDAWRRPEPAQLVPGLVARSHAWLMAEAEPIVNDSQPPAADGRVPGFCQVALLQRPPRLTVAEWLGIWKGSHWKVAIETQSTFGYRQNLVVCALSEGAPALDAIVEEDFPAEAMSSAHSFYAAQDDATLNAHQTAMMESCARFIDFDKIDVVPMSAYWFSPAVGP